MSSEGDVEPFCEDLIASVFDGADSIYDDPRAVIVEQAFCGLNIVLICFGEIMPIGQDHSRAMQSRMFPH